MFVSIAHAMGTGGAGGAQGGPEAMFSGIMPIILMLAIFYFLLVRPQQKRAKEHKAMLAALKKGDTVITNSGIIGRITDVEDEYLILDLGETRVRLSRVYVAGLSKEKLVKFDKKDGAKKAGDKKEESQNAVSDTEGKDKKDE